MRKVFSLLAVLILNMSLYGATSANQTVALTATAINELGVTGNITIKIEEDDLESGEMSKTDSSSSLNVTTNDSSKKITAALDSNLTLGALKLSLSSIASGTGASNVSLTATAQDVYSSLSKSAGTSTLTYEFEVPFDNYSSIDSQVREVTFTLTSE